MKKKNDPICTILWRDASYTFMQKMPEILPLPQLTTGFIMETNDDYTVIATNVSYDDKTGAMSMVDGFIVPGKTILEFRKIGNYNE
ncbi:MAG: hypothetical protein WCO84_01700 [bacterium]